MNKTTLQKAFREAKKAAGLDFSLTNPDGLGDCQSCVWAQKVLQVLARYYNVESGAYNPSKCIVISEALT